MLAGHRSDGTGDSAGDDNGGRGDVSKVSGGRRGGGGGCRW